METRVPYGNYRGNVLDETEKIWMALDTTIKSAGYEENDPIDLPVSFDFDSFTAD